MEPMEAAMLSDGIVSFWSAFDEKQVKHHPRAAALLRQTRARFAMLWPFRGRA
jgi:hypothetical protein